MPQWLAYRFISPVQINQVALRSRSDGGTYGQTPSTFAVESSDDGVAWALEWAVTGSTGWSVSAIRYFDRPA